MKILSNRLGKGYNISIVTTLNHTYPTDHNKGNPATMYITFDLKHTQQ